MILRQTQSASYWTDAFVVENVDLELLAEGRGPGHLRDSSCGHSDGSNDDEREANNGPDAFLAVRRATGPTD